MSVEVAWLASPEADVASYVLERSNTVLGPWVSIATIANDASSSYYEPGTGLFKYPDPDGTEFLWYRLKAIDTANLISDPSEPFRALGSIPAYEESQVKVNHDYPTPGALTYVTPAGVGVSGAVIRIFRADDYDLNTTAPPVAVTMTVEGGRWQNNIYLTPGYPYILLYSKEGLYGPDSARITV